MCDSYVCRETTDTGDEILVLFELVCTGPTHADDGSAVVTMQPVRTGTFIRRHA